MLEMMRYLEVNAIISKVKDVAWKTRAWSRAMLIEVPDNMANSDHPGKKKRLGKSEFELYNHCKRCYRCLTLFDSFSCVGCLHLLAISRKHNYFQE